MPPKRSVVAAATPAKRRGRPPNSATSNATQEQPLKRASKRGRSDADQLNEELQDAATRAEPPKKRGRKAVADVLAPAIASSERALRGRRSSVQNGEIADPREEPKTSIAKRGRKAAASIVDMAADIAEDAIEKPEEHKRGRGRPKKQVAVDESAIAPSAVAAERKGRGRAATKPAAQTSTTETTTGTRGNRGRSARNVDVQVDEQTAVPNGVPTETPKRRGRPPKAASIPAKEPESAVGKKRGRSAKSGVEAETEQHEETEAPPRKRGRPAAAESKTIKKPATKSEPEKAPKAAATSKRTGGRGATAASSTATRPRRAAKAPSAASTAVGRPKRTAAAPKTAPEVAPTAPKPRGRPAKNTKASSTAEVAPTAPKPRGRPAKNTKASSTAEVARGRPSKSTKASSTAKAASKASKAGPQTGSKSVPVKARGKTTTKAKAAKAESSATSGKPRGRPKSSKNKPKVPETTTPATKKVATGSATKEASSGSTAKASRGNARKSATSASFTSAPAAEEIQEDMTNEAGHRFWLMKAEPEPRQQNGIDISFSIDDLAAAAEPEMWDGVRNHVAKNNMKAMKKGDLAFFYHSNCKVPGIAGIMEIVEENVVDTSAFDEKHPYYDPKSKVDAPTWYCVRVAFKQKFDEPISLDRLKANAGPNGALENMQMLKQGRLSVSQVRPSEWRFIMNFVETREEVARQEDTIPDPQNDQDLGDLQEAEEPDEAEVPAQASSEALDRIPETQPEQDSADATGEEDKENEVPLPGELPTNGITPVTPTYPDGDENEIEDASSSAPPSGLRANGFVVAAPLSGKDFGFSTAPPTEGTNTSPIRDAAGRASPEKTVAQEWHPDPPTYKPPKEYLPPAVPTSPTVGVLERVEKAPAEAIIQTETVQIEAEVRSAGPENGQRDALELGGPSVP